MTILIVGINSYLGKYIAKAFEKNNDIVKKTSVRDDNWKKEDWSKIDTVVFCAALVHQKNNNLSRLTDFLRVNADLAYSVAKKAKKEGVKQFIYISSNDVIGSSNKKKKSIIITKDSIPNPKTPYAISKYIGEKYLTTLNDSDFHICIVRSPLIYGNNCPGNYSKLSKAIPLIYVFPKLNSARSMIYVENLAEFIRLLANNSNIEGIFYPQNNEYIKVDQLLQTIANCHGRNIILIRIPTVIVDVFMNLSDSFSKIFGTNIIDSNLSATFDRKYNIVDFNESIKRTELSNEEIVDC